MIVRALGLMCFRVTLLQLISFHHTQVTAQLITSATITPQSYDRNPPTFEDCDEFLQPSFGADC